MRRRAFALICLACAGLGHLTLGFGKEIREPHGRAWAVPINGHSTKRFVLLLLALSSPETAWQVLSTSPGVYHAELPCRQAISMKVSKRSSKRDASGPAKQQKQAASGFGSKQPAVAAPVAMTLEERRAEHMSLVQGSIQKAAPSILSQLSSNGYAIVDGLLPAATILEMKSEADTLHNNGLMSKQMLESKVMNENNEEEYQYKEHDGRLTVYLRGGDLYFKSPRLHEFTSAMGSSLSALINQGFPPARIGLTTITPKLAVSTSQGSDLGKHIDNHGNRCDEGDTRKISTLLYLNSDWEPSHGGNFRAYTGSSVHDHSDIKSGVATGLDEDGHAFVDIAPIGGRFLVFWADDLVHGVQPTLQENVERWALTVWLFSDDPNACQLNMREAKRHWPEIYGPLDPDRLIPSQ